MEVKKNAQFTDPTAQGVASTAKKLEVATVGISAHGFERLANGFEITAVQGTEPIRGLRILFAAPGAQ